MSSVTIERDGKKLAEVADSDAAFAWLLRNQGQSVHYAIRHGGYSVTDSEGKPLADFAAYGRSR